MRKHRLMIYWLATGIFVLVFAVQAQPQGIREKYKPVIDLSMQVMAMLEMEMLPELTFSSTQASAMLPVLTELQTKNTLTTAEATAYLQQLNEHILTLEQRDWSTTKANELFAEIFAPNSRPPIGLGLALRLMQSEPVNLVKDGPSKDALTELVEILGNKTS